ncbi:Polynucleotidyl transferase, ribonuclease H-like superfamily protein [Arabidopsis thaliana]|uniref:Polynucleotidyl transferase, ribonuclease H-like superfamily protein n=1 Tax=Arabidopsis thaliana TaxID=3702 RepID=F4J9R7_ARATH|nr:Polynucleotidyl transferase, ribonuclease H-like superfamily protein [Arabidopsis thaliana]AEE75195.1 Polynucleotidyl transferase, ribonuclease H-like superfamily protein [Arabidopsis thaliana]|eukprot:NP_187848.2 Polynucleotidyl transferase, ribonuclease H-like superfamily protein [Arabidopsis thaliana]
MATTIRTGGYYSTHQEYSIDVFGNTLSVTVTSDFAIISQWIHEVEYNNCRPYYLQPLVVGVGVQWTPPVSYDANPPPDRYYSDHHPPRSYDPNPPPNRYYSDHHPPHPPADTLQLCVGNQCLIIQLCHCDQVPTSLRSFLTDPNTTFVGVWNSQDAGKLARSKHQLEIGKLLDIRTEARSCDKHE